MEREHDAVAETLVETRETGDQADVSADADVVEELLIEEISIDGMCGVY